MGVPRIITCTLGNIVSANIKKVESSMRFLFACQKTDSFNVDVNGLQLVENMDYIDIYNDPFSSVLLFITKKYSGR